MRIVMRKNQGVKETRKHQGKRVTCLTALGLSLLTAIQPGCATIIKGGEQPIAIKSTPSDATLTVYDERTHEALVNAKTPQVVTLKRGAGYFKNARYRVVIQKENYVPRELMITGGLSGWYLGGNLIFGGLIGYLILDPLTGAMWTLSPDGVDENLPQTSASEQKEASLVVMLKDELPAMSAETLSKLKPLPLEQVDTEAGG